MGVVSTLAYLLLVSLLRDAIGLHAANVVALLVTAIGNTAANRRLTFSVGGSKDRWRHLAQGVASLGLALGLTSGSIVLLHAVVPAPAEPFELVVLVAANVAATLLRFALLRLAFHARAERDEQQTSLRDDLLFVSLAGLGRPLRLRSWRSCATPRSATTRAAETLREWCWTRRG